MNTYSEVFDAIDQTATIDLVATLVQTPSHPGVPHQEAAVVAALAEFLEQGGLRPELPRDFPWSPAWLWH